MNLGFGYIVHKASTATFRSNVTHSQVFQKQVQAGKPITVTFGIESVVVQ